MAKASASSPLAMGKKSAWASNTFAQAKSQRLRRHSSSLWLN
jgi:hypothetical protein